MPERRKARPPRASYEAVDNRGRPSANGRSRHSFDRIPIGRRSNGGRHSQIEDRHRGRKDGSSPGLWSRRRADRRPGNRFARPRNVGSTVRIRQIARDAEGQPSSWRAEICGSKARSIPLGRGDRADRSRAERPGKERRPASVIGGNSAAYADRNAPNRGAWPPVGLGRFAGPVHSLRGHQNRSTAASHWYAGGPIARAPPAVRQQMGIPGGARQWPLYRSA